MDNFSTQLPNDIIDQFGKNLNCIEDFLSFGCVCKSWYQSFQRIKKKHPPFSPVLMLVYKEDAQNVQTFHTFSADKKHLNLSIPHALIQGKRCLGSPFGWVVTIGLDLQIHLLNPFSRDQIPLPSQPTFPHQCRFIKEPEDIRQMFVHKFVLSSTPSDESGQSASFVVIAIYLHDLRLAFAKLGDEAWTSIESPQGGGYEDAIFFNGQIYAIDWEGILCVCEIDNGSPKAIEIASPPDHEGGDSNKFYLVEMSGDLLLVERIVIEIDRESMLHFHYCTVYFQVFKFDFEENLWNMLLDIGDHALFIGNNTSFALSTSEFPRFKRNCIYFTDDHLETYPYNNFCDMGFHDLAQKINDGVETRDEGDTREETWQRDDTEENTREQNVVLETEDTTNKDVTEDLKTVDSTYKVADTGSTFYRPLFIMPCF
ncbi:F-box protein skip23 [Thalictrum thalictroides]|uniref:F-box protein skip23 n=1 Tax=Thalictrum thalictroides TaxID=46969 RepID=A0A7J6X309_THATH|nr:F-box protein skip23 [Thalictrum thalictroides]